MLGRGTRLCEDLYGKGEDKKVFRIFDAVDLYSTLKDVSTMKPVVADPSVKLETLIDELKSNDDEKLRKRIVEDITVRIRRKKKHLIKKSEAIQSLFGLSFDDVEHTISSQNTKLIEELFVRNPKLADFIENAGTGKRKGIPVSEHEDMLLSAEHGYGAGKRPKDYIDSFTQWLQTNVNEIAALKLITQRPREMTRKHLIEVKEILDAAGYTEANLRTAWRDWRNEDIAASIIGYIRTQSLGSALVPYNERVDNALKKILKKRAWTSPQRTWLERIAKQIKIETILDRTAIDNGQFRADGGFNKLNKIFEGQLETLLGDFQDEIWQESA
jgi:type I restriction enzyme R subunit